MTAAPPAAEFVRRLDAVTERLARHASSQPSPGLTDPDQPSGERWEWGQVWAHMAEFPAYWMRQIREVLATPPREPPPFGRVKTDPGRVAAIEAGRGAAHGELWERVSWDLSDVRVFIQRLNSDDWSRTVRHSTLGVMEMPKVLDVFLVGHLESHADQLDGLASG